MGMLIDPTAIDPEKLCRAVEAKTGELWEFEAQTRAGTILASNTGRRICVFAVDQMGDGGRNRNIELRYNELGR